MDKQLFPLGTIVQVKDRKLMIAGYIWSDAEGRKVLKYIALPYPYGFTEKGGILELSENVSEVVAMGFRSKGFDAIERYFSEIRRVSETVSAEELDRYLQKAANINKERDSI